MLKIWKYVRNKRQKPEIFGEKKSKKKFFFANYYSKSRNGGEIHEIGALNKSRNGGDHEFWNHEMRESPV